jgi:hypothetical protein
MKALPEDSIILTADDEASQSISGVFVLEDKEKATVNNKQI